MTKEEVKEFIRSMDADALRQLLTIRALIREGKIEHDFANSCLIFRDEETRRLAADQGLVDLDRYKALGSFLERDFTCSVCGHVGPLESCACCPYCESPDATTCGCLG